MKNRSDARTDVGRHLANIPILSELNDSAYRLIVDQSQVKLAEKGDILFFESDPSDSTYIVITGRVSIVVTSPDGREMVINEMHPGDLFGELGVLTKQNRSASAIVHSKSELLVIPGPTLLNILEKDAKLCLAILRITANRLHLSGKRERALAFLDAQARLARLLLDLEELEHDKGYVTISQDELAQHTGLIRQTVAKALGKWRRAGWLITGRGRILILNKKALRELEANLLL